MNWVKEVEIDLEHNRVTDAFRLKDGEGTEGDRTGGGRTSRGCFNNPSETGGCLERSGDEIGEKGAASVPFLE